ncbi:Flp family type IVb pilin [Paractinoplanes hotanensis]|uniref:Flp family type IVb pilin n=1 Tax=Paractinoplanes hotanensis TaxID=2906497 RepID=A0ABT0XVN8_9ACTN|nr:Flp family type IVb pilin [Actinoplanes hotanensis]MCM4077851.1 Flp family type IVb pilin [Actinoplanes hotanensis]
MLPFHYVAAYLQSRLTSAGERLAKKGDEGATAVEYGLLISLVAVVIIVGATTFGNQISALFTAVAGKIKMPA